MDTLRDDEKIPANSEKRPKAGSEDLINNVCASLETFVNDASTFQNNITAPPPLLIVDIEDSVSLVDDDKKRKIKSKSPPLQASQRSTSKHVSNTINKYFIKIYKKVNTFLYINISTY